MRRWRTAARGWTAAIGLVAVLALPPGPPAARGEGFEAPAPLGGLIDSADAVVAGTVTEVAERSFTLRVGQVLAGRVEGKLLQVTKPSLPATSPRWAPYCAEQEEVVFLAAPDPAGPFRILGRIGEGEIPLDADFAYFHGRRLATLQPDYHRLDGQRVYLQRHDRADTLDAIRSYPRCLEWIRSESPPRWRTVITCTRDDLAAYRSRSPVHEFLVSEAEAAAATP